MFRKKKNSLELREVKLCSFVNVPSELPDPTNILEIDPNSIKTILAEIREDFVLDEYANAFHILQRDERGKIKSSERDVIRKKKLYVYDINYDKEISKRDQKKFYSHLKQFILSKDDDIKSYDTKIR